MKDDFREPDEFRPPDEDELRLVRKAIDAVDQGALAAQIRELMTTLTDRVPFVPRKVRMSSSMWDAVKRSIERAKQEQESRNPLSYQHGSLPIHLGMEVYINDDLPFGDWEEWDGVRWRPSDPLGLSRLPWP